MQFYTSNATGDSGLFYLGHWIVQNYQFPFRVMSSDIGIDAEIEIINDSLHSEGLIIKCQVKSTNTQITGNFTEYIERKHLIYWLKMSVPVIYFKVDLITHKIYFKVISSFDDIERTKEDNAENWKISFDLNQDLLTMDSKNAWVEKFKLIEFHNLYQYFEDLKLIIESISPNVDSYDADKLEQDKIEEAYTIIKKLDNIAILYPWKFGKKLKSELENLQSVLRTHQTTLSYYGNQLGSY